MWSMITLCEPEYPPVLEEVHLGQADGSTKSEFTYGGYVLDDKFKHIDHNLRRVIVDCLMYDPTRRPTMHYLEALLNRHLSRSGPVTPMDMDAQDVAENLFKGPSPPYPEPAKLREMGGLKAWYVNPGVFRTAPKTKPLTGIDG